MRSGSFFWVGYWVVYVVVYLLTLHLWPLAWYDEIAISSTGLDYLERGTFFARVTKTFDKGFESPYGPVFFWWAYPWYAVFGFGMWPHRAAVFVSGLAVLGATAALLQISGLSKHQTRWVVLAMSADWMFVKALREGRMDFLALFFVLISVYAILIFQKKETILWMGISGLAIAASFLTSTRIVIFSFLWLYLAFFIIKKPHLLLIWFLCGFLPVLCWVFYYYGSLWAYFEHISETMSGYSRLLGWTINFSKHQILSVFLYSYSLVYLYLNSSIKIPAVYMSILSITGFYLLIYDFGYYGIYLTPFYYWVVGMAFGDYARKANFVA